MASRETSRGLKFSGPDSFACYQAIKFTDDASWTLKIEFSDLSKMGTFNFFFGERGTRYQGFVCLKNKIYYRLLGGEYIGGIVYDKSRLVRLMVTYRSGIWVFTIDDKEISCFAKQAVEFNAIGSGFTGFEHEGETNIYSVKITSLNTETLKNIDVAQWDLIENKGCIAFDKSGKQHHALLVNTMWLTQETISTTPSNRHRKAFWKPYTQRKPKRKYDFLKTAIEKPANEGIYSMIKPSLTQFNAEKGKKILQGIYSFNRFNDVQLPLTLDWNEDPYNNKSWQWQFQQLIFSVSLMAASHMTGNTAFDDKLKDTLLSWYQKNYKTKPPSTLSWHDHTTALRLRNLIYSWEYLRLTEQGMSMECASALLNMIESHCIVLSDDHFYSKHTNHGFDQSLFLYLASITFPEFEHASFWQKLAFDRLLSEISIAFTSEGMHVENSPSYQVDMLQKVQFTLQFFDCLGQQQFSHLDKLVNSALRILAILMRPDKQLPLLGDTDLGTKIPTFKGYESYPNYQFFKKIDQNTSAKLLCSLTPLTVLAESGYAVYRKGDQAVNKDSDLTHIVFKCGFLSTYHRHDDDLNILIYALGEDWLIDGGIYQYDEKNKYRHYLRSTKAHNVPLIENGIALRKINQLRPSKIVNFNDENNDTWVKGESFIHEGIKISRKINFIDFNEIIISDSVALPIGTVEFYTVMFHLPKDKTIRVQDKEVTICSPSGHQMTMLFSGDFDVIIEVFSGQSKPEVLGWQSLRLGDLQAVNSIRCRIYPKNRDYSSSVKIKIHPKPQ
ncbi:heparinase II/III family protein [uncultured Shewanella sp.]|uniref:heparinase II/III family protein n=1 Tax=uncultured Shewanella sp. TaxID=173975 RepID=UPI00262B5488|nr:heparinase II/III family protein [uncultured Shewanella sp.]